MRVDDVAGNIWQAPYRQVPTHGCHALEHLDHHIAGAYTRSLFSSI